MVDIVQGRALRDLELLCQTFLLLGNFKIESLELFAQAGHDPPDHCLLSS
jgi:hypothetical protein